MIHKRVNAWMASWTLAVCLLGGPGLLAQEIEAPKKPLKGIQVQLLAVELLEDVPRIVLRHGETTSEAIDLPTHGLSEPLGVRSRSLVVATPGTAEEPGRALTKVTLPSVGKRFLLLLVPGKDSYGARVVRLDDPAFKPGSVCFFNVCPIPIAGTLGSTKFLAKPVTPVITSPPRQGELPYYQVSFYYKKGETTRPFADTRWPYDDRSRSFVFFYPKTKTGRISYRAVDEYIPVGGE